MKSKVNVFLWIAFLASAAGLILNLTRAISADGTTGLALFAYFTIQSNTILAVISGCMLFSKHPLWWRPLVHAGATLYVVITFFIFLVLLQPTYHVKGIDLAISILLHYIAPLSMFIHWIKTQQKNTLTLATLKYLSIYPAVYFSIALAYGLFGFPIYPFFEFQSRGISVVLPILFLLLAYTTLNFLFLAINYRKPKK